MGHSYGLLEPLFHVKERDVYQRLIFKAAANDNYPSSGADTSAMPTCKRSVIWRICT